MILAITFLRIWIVCLIGGRDGISLILKMIQSSRSGWMWRYGLHRKIALVTETKEKRKLQ